MNIIGVKAFGSSHRICFIYRELVKSGCKMILTPKARIQLMVFHGILAPNDCRICSLHLRVDNTLNNNVEVCPGYRQEKSA